MTLELLPVQPGIADEPEIRIEEIAAAIARQHSNRNRC